MRFSIVTISYNQAEFLEEALKSVIAQKGAEVEYTVVEGGSSDGSAAIVERYRDRVDRIIRFPNSTATQCLNRGFAEAKGDVYGFLNSDDVLLPGALGKAQRAFESRTNLDVVSAHGWVIDRYGKRLHKIFSHKVDWRHCFYDCCTLVQQSTFFRADLFHKVGGFDESSTFHWDGDLFMRFARTGAQFGIVHDYWSFYRIHRGSLRGSSEYWPKAENWYREQRAKQGLPEVSTARLRCMQYVHWFRQPITLALRVADGLLHPSRTP
jgi:glycosyltransferase involved in cell wall biosynthesis